MTDSVVERFASLFAGRTDAYGGETGVCVRQTVTDYEYRRHLEGGEPIGIYPVVHGRTNSGSAWQRDFFCVKWGACDIDYDDLVEAINFHDLLAQVGIPSYIERSRAKGFHIWCFVENWISAETMRHGLLVVRDFLKMEARELYPKQTTLKEGELGNYLRLPYPGALSSHSSMRLDRRVMFGLDGSDVYPLTLTEFLDRVRYADPAHLEKLASRYQPPVVSEVRWQREGADQAQHDYIARAALNRIDVPLAWHIFNVGPMPGGDRSSTLMRLCNLVMDKGATMEEAFSIIWSADMKDWAGKYVYRHDGEDRIRQLVERVYSSQGSH